MQKIITILMVSSLILRASLPGQDFRGETFDHPLGAGQGNPDREVSGPVTSLRILAVMVEFQKDNDTRTSGDGSFDLRDTSKLFLDAPPHDRPYFSHHLSFLKNYYEKVSDGQLSVSFDLRDSVYLLPHEMKYYSPPKSSAKNAEIGSLVADTWRTVDSASLAHGEPVDYTQYNTFIIFHAGVGRDVDLATLYGYDPTPFDIPSLYVNLNSMRTMFGDENYQGVEVDSGRFRITSSVIIPETETREQVPFPLGINGLVVASVGSHLELPDLFNTKTGSSAIGRFGLMDGQSIFSWNGAFPPEPSAWEKQYLGWIKPLTITVQDSIYRLPAKSLSLWPDTTLRVPINATEYFLIENRNRDADKNGSIITMMVGDDTVRRVWFRDTTNFNANDPDSLYGVVIDVDEFDWSLPGGVDGRSKIFYDGGILIWHIDEKIINARISSNTINADEDARGVNLMEADGSPDIGESYDLLHPGAGSENGTPLDFWFAGNTAPLRRYDTTGFTPKSLPHSNSNAGANSHIYVNRFSERGEVMSLRVKLGDERVSPLAGFPKFVGEGFSCNDITPLGSDHGYEGIVTTANPANAAYGSPGYQPPALFGWKFDGSPLVPGVGSTPLPRPLQFQDGIFFGKIAAADLTGDSASDIAAGVVTDGPPAGSHLAFYSLEDQEPDGSLDSLDFTSVAGKISTSPVVSDSFVAYGSTSGSVYFVKRNSLSVAVSIRVFDSAEVSGLSLLRGGSYLALSTGGGLRIISPYSLQPLGEEKKFDMRFTSPAASGVISGSSYWRDQVGTAVAVASDDGRIMLLDSSLNLLGGFPVATGGRVGNAPALADVDGDNVKDIVVFSGNKIYAVNPSGAILDNFPVSVGTEKPILSAPIIADLNGDNINDIVAVTQEGIVAAYDARGRMLDGFPLLAGPNSGATPAAFYMTSSCLSCVDIGLAVASDDGRVYAWRTGSLFTSLGLPPEMPWPQFMHDAQNSGLSTQTASPAGRSGELMPTERAYNWPNPVMARDNFITHFRYYLSENSAVHFKIIDPAGDLVEEFDRNGIGGMDNEFEWDASKLQSGVYFVHLEAKGQGSAGGHSIFKMAIIR